MVYVVLQNMRALSDVNEDKGDESLPLLAFRRNVANAIFLKYSKEGRSSSSHAGIRNIISDVCYDDAEHYQVPSEKQCWCRENKKNYRHRCIKFKINLHDICLEIFHEY